MIFFVGFVVSKCQRWPHFKTVCRLEFGSVDCGSDGHVSRGCTVLYVVSGWCRAPFPSHNRVSCCVVLEHWVLVTKRRMRNPLTPGNNGRPCPTRPSRLYNTAALVRLVACLLSLYSFSYSTNKFILILFLGILVLTRLFTLSF